MLVFAKINFNRPPFGKSNDLYCLLLQMIISNISEVSEKRVSGDEKRINPMVCVQSNWHEFTQSGDGYPKIWTR